MGRRRHPVYASAPTRLPFSALHKLTRAHYVILHRLRGTLPAAVAALIVSLCTLQHAQAHMHEHGYTRLLLRDTRLCC